MANENFTTYNEVDPNSRISKTASRVTWLLLQRNETAYVDKDKGANFFSGNFICELTFRVTGGTNGGLVNLWTMANLENDWQAIDDASGDGLAVFCKRHDATGVPRISIEELDGGTSYGEGTLNELDDDTDYYLTIERDEDVGTFGTFYLRTYSDSGRTNLIETQTITLHSSKKDYRFIYGVQARNPSGVQSISAFVEDLNIKVSPIVTTQAMTEVAYNTATGNGNVTDLGNDSVTAHGHVFNTTGTPDLTDDSVDNGAKGATGAYTLALVELTPNTKYFVRAFATNSIGTGFGAQVTFFSSRQNVPPGRFANQFVVVDWDDDDDFSDAESDITADVLDIPSISYGKNRELEQAVSASIFLKVNNANHKYSQPNTSSALNTDGNTLIGNHRIIAGLSFPFDEFTDSDAVGIESHIVPNDSSFIWSEEAGTFVIDTNQIKNSSSGGIAVLDFEEPNASVQVKFKKGADNDGILILRFSNTSNYLYVRTTNTDLELRKVVATVDTLIQGVTHAWAVGATKTLKVVLHNEFIWVIVDLTQVIPSPVTGVPLSDSHNETETKHGIGGPSIHADARYDDFGGVYPLFFGTIDRIIPNPDQDQQTAIIEASDDLKILANTIFYRRAHAFGGFPADMGAFAEEVIKNLPAVSQLGEIFDTGETIPNERHKSWWGISALDVWRMIEREENGFGYIDPDGIWRFEAKGHRAASPHDASLATFYDTPATNNLAFSKLKWESGEFDVKNLVSVHVEIAVKTDTNNFGVADTDGGYVWRAEEADVLDGGISSSLLSIPASGSKVIYFEAKEFEAIENVINPTETPGVWALGNGTVVDGPFRNVITGKPLPDNISASISGVTSILFELQRGDLIIGALSGALNANDEFKGLTNARLKSYQVVKGTIAGGPFTIGEVVTFNGGGSGVTGRVISATSDTITVGETSGTILAGDTGTGGISGATINGTLTLTDNRITQTLVKDYVANADADGSGADKTGSLTVTLSHPFYNSFGRGGKLLLENSDGSTIYITRLVVRGRAFVLRDRGSVFVEDSTSQANFGEHSFNVDAKILDTLAQAQTLADDIETKEDNPRAKVIIRLRNATKENLLKILSLKLSDRITLNFSGMGLNEDFYINKKEFAILEGGLSIDCDLTLEEVS